MRRSFHFLSAAFLACLVTGCRADVTERIAVTGDRTLSMTYAEVLDDEAFQNVQRLGGDDPFRQSAARSDGWKVTEESRGNTHLVTFSKTFPVTKARIELLRVAYDSRTARSTGYDFDPWSVIGDAPSGNEVPALLRPLEVLKVKGHDPNANTARANALINAQIVESVVGLHLEIKGIAAPAKQWNLHFATPTSVTYEGDDVIAALLRTRTSPVWPLPPSSEFWRNAGEFGIFDYERWGQPPCQINAKYRQASKFGIGVYAGGAGIPSDLLDDSMAVVESYLLKHPWKCA